MRAEPTLDARGRWSPFVFPPPSSRGRLARQESYAQSLLSGFPDSDAARSARVAENESIFRRANEQLEERFREFGARGLTPFLCECGDMACTQVIRLNLDEYEAVRTEGARFAIVPGHQILEAERVVEENGRFDVVEKTDGGRWVAEAQDPR
jgi:hypothetical protein